MAANLERFIEAVYNMKRRMRIWIVIHSPSVRRHEQ